MITLAICSALFAQDPVFAASEADAMPLPREDTTPPVTKIYRVMENLSKRDQKA